MTRIRFLSLAAASLIVLPGAVAGVAGELEPAFSGQTRAPALASKTRLRVREIAVGFDKRWAIAFLPDGRMLVTKKPSGRLYVVTREGERSSPVAGLPRVDGRDQGGLLDVAVAPDYAASRRIYWT